MEEADSKVTVSVQGNTIGKDWPGPLISAKTEG